MLNVGVIGVGYLGEHHARIFSELARESDAIRLAAIVDIDRERAKEIAKKYGCDVCYDYRDIFGRVDALSIVTPTTTHYEIARECIKAGKDILIEKPITTTVEEADDLIALSENVGVIVQVGHLERFNPVFSAVRSLIDNPMFFEAERLSPFLGRGIDVDIAIDLMIHDIDIILALNNKDEFRAASLEKNNISDNLLPSGRYSAMIKDIKATGAKIMTDNFDTVMAWLEFDNGVQALITASRISEERSRRLKIFQKNSYILVDYQDMEIKRFFKDGDKVLQEPFNIEKKEPLKEELRDFVKCVIARRRPVVSVIEGRNALKVAIQIVEKIKNDNGIL